MAGVTWEELKEGIEEAFSRDRVDVDKVKHLMSTYQSKRSDWEQYEHFDKHKLVTHSYSYSELPWTLPEMRPLPLNQDTLTNPKKTDWV